MNIADEGISSATAGFLWGAEVRKSLVSRSVTFLQGLKESFP